MYSAVHNLKIQKKIPKGSPTCKLSAPLKEYKSLESGLSPFCHTSKAYSVSLLSFSYLSPYLLRVCYVSMSPYRFINSRSPSWSLILPLSCNTDCRECNLVGVVQLGTIHLEVCTLFLPHVIYHVQYNPVFFLEMQYVQFSFMNLLINSSSL